MDKITRMTILILIFLLIHVPSAVFAAPPDTRPAGKVIVLILDNISLADYQDVELTNFRQVINSGGVGLMNARVKSLTRTNRISSYLTAAMGVRVFIPLQDVVAAGSQHGLATGIEIKDFAEIKKTAEKNQPNYTLGKIGETAKVNDLKVSFVGNSDTEIPAGESMLLAIDNQGQIPLAAAGKQLLRPDLSSPWGFSTDPDKLLQLSLQAINRSEIIFIDFGDTFRVSAAAAKFNVSIDEQERLRRQAMRKADSFLGALMKELANQQYILAVITPSPSYAQKISGSMALTPLILYDKSEPAGLVASLTTRRVGLVSNIDLGPTILGKLIDERNLPDFLGEEISVVSETENLLRASQQLAEYKHLYFSRNVVHGLYVVLIATSLFVLFWPLLKNRPVVPEKFSRALGIMVIALPLVSFIIFPFTLNSAILTKYHLDSILLVLGLILVGFSLNQTWERSRTAIAWLSIVTSLVILLDLFRGWELLIRTPLGFDNVFAGGRYYGINNDCMGILLGSTVFGLFYLLDKVRPPRAVMAIIVLTIMGLVVFSQMPAYGANVGGTIAAMTTGIIAFLTILAHRKVKKWWVLVILGLVFGIELLIAYLDYLFGWQTHAGKVMGALLSQGFGRKLGEVLISKLSLFSLMLVVPPYNILLAAQLFIYYFVSKKLTPSMQRINFQYPIWALSVNVLFMGGMVAFIFNDTGVIATALMLSYLTVPLGLTIGSLPKR